MGYGDYNATVNGILKRSFFKSRNSCGATGKINLTKISKGLQLTNLSSLCNTI